MPEISIQWRQDYEFLECATTESKRVKLATPVWRPFDVEDIYWHSRNHCIRLFNNGTPVVIKEDDKFVVNSDDLLRQYKRRGLDVKLLADCEPSTKSVIDVGFTGSNH